MKFTMVVWKPPILETIVDNDEERNPPDSSNEMAAKKPKRDRISLMSIAPRRASERIMGNRRNPCLENTHGRNTRSKVISNNIQVLNDEIIPYLDVNIGYNADGDVDFKVGMKKGTCLKYVNKSSNHSSTVLKEVPRGVFERLTKLTTMTDERRKMHIEELYPSKKLKKECIQ